MTHREYFNSLLIVSDCEEKFHYVDRLGALKRAVWIIVAAKACRSFLRLHWEVRAEHVKEDLLSATKLLDSHFHYAESLRGSHWSR